MATTDVDISDFIISRPDETPITCAVVGCWLAYHMISLHRPRTFVAGPCLAGSGFGRIQQRYLKDRVITTGDFLTCIPFHTTHSLLSSIRFPNRPWRRSIPPLPPVHSGNIKASLTDNNHDTKEQSLHWQDPRGPENLPSPPS